MFNRKRIQWKMLDEMFKLTGYSPKEKDAPKPTNGPQWYPSRAAKS